jgi:hypothetical protein
MTDERITQQELIELFGPILPMTAVILLFESKDPLDVIRVKLREIAASSDLLEQRLCDLLEADTPEEVERIKSLILNEYKSIIPERYKQSS